MAHRHPIKVLVTGFGPFPGVRDNPSGELVHLIKEERLRLSSGVILRTAVIPTSWMAVEQFVQKDLAAFDPDIALHFGVSSRARGFRIERVARNTFGTGADCEGRVFVQPCLVRGAPATLPATIDAEKLARKLRERGLNTAASRDAGRYLCNMLLYLSLNQISGRIHVRQTGFIHIPLLKTGPHRAPALDMAGLLTGAQIILNHCVGVQRRLNRMPQKAV